MTQRLEFAYHNIELYKSQSLGSGSYGGVCRAKCDGLLCAAKIMHPTLFDLHDPGAASYLQKFQEECHLLSLARHPNVVQYLTTCYDPSTRLPVLLMELCNGSLTDFLERSPGPLSYHIQLNICHDIALALVYLHSNGLIHRDLTGNNVLMVAGPRAKITDFGMSKLATVNPRMTALTLCPGNLLYMSPEALDEAHSYTAKLDIFSFGVIVIQILTRQFPKPTDRFRNLAVAEDEDEVRVVVRETERRQTHLKLIPETHTLKPIVLQCLQKEKQRPSALELSERLSELKQSSEYTESARQTQSTSDIQQLQEQLHGQRILTDAKKRLVNECTAQITQLQTIVEESQHRMDSKDAELQEKQQIIDTKNRELQEKQHMIETNDRELQEKQRMIETNDRELQEKQHMIGTKDRELQEKQSIIETKDRELQEKQHMIETKDRELQASTVKIAEGTFQASCAHPLEMKERQLQQTQEKLIVSEQLVGEFQQSLEQKEKIISNLQQTISSLSLQLQQQQESATASQTAPAPRDIIKMTWRQGKKAPQEMTAGAAVVHGNTAYFRPAFSNKLYSYQNKTDQHLDEEQWSLLLLHDCKDFGLAVINGLVTSLGGYRNGYTNFLLSLTGEGEMRKWSKIYPPMPTSRSNAACVTTEEALVVAGGYAEGDLNTVEVMNINTKQWTTVSPLPQPLSQLSCTVCGDTLYIAGSSSHFESPSKYLFTCCIPGLFKTQIRVGSRLRRSLNRSRTPNMWKEIHSIPAALSTLASFNGELLAIGGMDASLNRTSTVYRYNPPTDSWSVVSHMKTKRSSCLAATFQDCIVVVGGFTTSYSETDSVEILQ